MPVYRLTVAYDGTRFHGFQRQIENAALTAKTRDNYSNNPVKKRPVYEPDGTRKNCCISVQEVLELVILQDLYPNQTTADEVCLKFSGRTDKGVHARGQTVTVNLPTTTTAGSSSEEEQPNVWKLRQSFNSRLPVDISVVAVACLGPSTTFDPRRDVVQKRYSYTLKYQRKLSEKDQKLLGGPLNSIRHALNDPPCLWVCPWALDDTHLPKLVERLQGTHDYSAFVHKAVRKERENTLTVSSIQFTVMNTRTDFYYYETNGDGPGKEEPFAVPVDFVTARFEFAAKGFRRTMLRNLVGYCVDVCRGLEGVPAVDQVFDAEIGPKARINAAPASGLCLESVSY